MKMLSKDDILKAQDMKQEVVDVPEWGGKVIIQSMSSKARDEWEMTMINQNEKNKMDNIRATLVAACLVDEEGNNIFSSKDIAALGKKSAKVLDKLFAVAQKVSGIGENDVEELAKN